VRAGQRTSFDGSDLNLGGFCKDHNAQHESRLLGLFGTWLLVVHACEGRPSTQTFAVIDLSAKADLGKPLIVPLAKFLPQGTKILDATLSADHTTLSVMTADAAGRPAVARGAAPTTLGVHPLPPEAKSVAFVDARRGMAIGSHLGQVWATTDGAATWTSLPMPLDGDPAAVPLVYPATCTIASCSSGEDLVWANPRALRETGFVQPAFVLPRHVAPQRPYVDPRPRYPSSFIGLDRGAKPSGCPDATAARARAAKRGRGAHRD